jgi:thioredoxin 1
MIKHINSEEFESDVLTSKEIVLVDFYADWCGPCRMIAPILEEIENVNIFKVNVDDNEELAMKYGIMSIPCLISFKDGKEYKRSVGLKDKETILELIK